MSGEAGYADYQKVMNWDGPTLFPNTLIENANRTQEIGDVSRYASLKLSMTPGEEAGKVATQSKFEVEWFSNDPVRQLLGVTIFALGALSDHPTAKIMKLRLPNQGPFCQIKMATLVAGAKIFWQLWAGGDNRQLVLPHTLGFPYLLSLEKIAIGAKASKGNPFTAYYAGPVTVAVQTNKTPGVAAIEAIDPTTEGLWKIIDAVPVKVANEWVKFTTIAPVGAVRFSFQNESAEAAEYSAHVVPSPTGSS